MSYSSNVIINEIISGKLGWEKTVACMGETFLQNISRKSAEKRLLRYRRKHNFKKDLQNVVTVCLAHSARSGKGK